MNKIMLVIEVDNLLYDTADTVRQILNGRLEKDYDLIMYTCYPNKELYGNKRLIIYAKLDKTKWVGES